MGREMHEQIHTWLKGSRYVKSVRGRHTREYRAYRDMLNRCYREKHNRYHRYGGRGIGVCPEWLGDGGFDAFVDSMGICPEDMSLDRVNNDEDYRPSNCRWATRSEQALNRASTRRISFNGQTLSIKEWAEVAGIPESTLERRINNSSMGIEKALTTPVRRYRRDK